MSTCHTVRFRVQNTREQAAREAIDAYLTALEADGSGVRLSVLTRLVHPDDQIDYVQVVLCDDESGCRCDDPSPALTAFEDALRPLLVDPIERSSYAILHEGHRD